MKKRFEKIVTLSSQGKNTKKPEKKKTFFGCNIYIEDCINNELIQKNNGKVLNTFEKQQITHYITNSHRPIHNLNPKSNLVSPNWIEECVSQQKLLSPNLFLPLESLSTHVIDFSSFKFFFIGFNEESAYFQQCLKIILNNKGIRVPFLSRYVTHVIVEKPNVEESKELGLFLEENCYRNIFVVKSEWAIKCYEKSEYINPKIYEFSLKKKLKDDLFLDDDFSQSKLSIGDNELEKVFLGKTFSFASKNVKNWERVSEIIVKNGGKMRQKNQSKFIIYSSSSSFNITTSSQCSITTYYIQKCVEKKKMLRIKDNVLFSPLFPRKSKSFFGDKRITICSTEVIDEARKQISIITPILGGMFTNILSQDVDILISTQNSVSSDKYLAALEKFKIPIVNLEWIFESARKGYFIDPQQYYHENSKEYAKENNYSRQEFVENSNIQPNFFSSSFVNEEDQTFRNNQNETPVNNNSKRNVDNVTPLIFQMNNTDMNGEEKILSFTSQKDLSQNSEEQSQPLEPNKIENHFLVDDQLKKLIPQNSLYNDDEFFRMEIEENSISPTKMITRSDLLNPDFFVKKNDKSQTDLSQRVVFRNSPYSGNNRVYNICTSNYKRHEIDSVKKIISELGGVYQENIDENTTHLIVKHKLTGNEKILKGIVKGVWILKERFLLDSSKEKRFVSESEYMFKGKQGLAKAIQKSDPKKNDGKRIFSKWIVGLLFVRIPNFDDILKFGKANIYYLRDDDIMYGDITHLFVNKKKFEKNLGNQKFLKFLEMYVKNETMILFPSVLEIIFCNPFMDLKEKCLNEKILQSLEKNKNESKKDDKIELKRKREEDSNDIDDSDNLQPPQKRVKR